MAGPIAGYPLLPGRYLKVKPRVVTQSGTDRVAYSESPRGRLFERAAQLDSDQANLAHNRRLKQTLSPEHAAMRVRTLIRRRTQLELLAAAARRGAPARLTRRRTQSPPAGGRCQLLEFGDDGVWLSLPEDSDVTASSRGVAVLVEFDHEGRQFRFPAEVRRCEAHLFERHGPLPAVLVSLPLRVAVIRDCDRRGAGRITLPEDQGLRARLTRVNNRNRTYELSVRDISDGGLGGRLADPTLAGELDSESLYWAEVELGPDKRPLDFVVRLIHVCREAGTTGWGFSPGDDTEGYRRNLRRLRDYVEHQRSAAPAAPPPQPALGG